MGHPTRRSFITFSISYSGGGPQLADKEGCMTGAAEGVSSGQGDS